MKEKICLSVRRACGTVWGNRGAYALLLFVFALFLFFGRCTPVYWGDDLLYTHVWKEDVSFFRQAFVDAPRVDGIRPLLECMRIHYMYWHGRLPAVFLSFFFGWVGKDVFNVLNAFMFVFLGVLVYWCGNGGRMSSWFRWDVLAFIYLSVWWLYGTVTFLWITGSCNYLWTGCTVLFFLRFYIYGHFGADGAYGSVGPFGTVLFFLLGVLAGATNENAVLAVIVFILSLFWMKRPHRPSAFLLAGFVGLLCGYCIMMGCPGTMHRIPWTFEQFSRQDIVLGDMKESLVPKLEETRAWIAESCRRIEAGDRFGYLSLFSVESNLMDIAKYFVEYLLLVVAVAFGIRFMPDGEEKGLVLRLFGCGLLSVSVLVLSPYMVPDSSLFFLYVLLVCSVYVYDGVIARSGDARVRFLWRYVSVMLLCFFMVTGFLSVRKACVFGTEYAEFLSFVAQNRGRHVVLYVPDGNDRTHFLTYKYVRPFYLYGEYKKDSWIYRSAERYYGLRKLTVYRGYGNRDMLLFAYD